MSTFAGFEVSTVDDLASDYGRWLIHGPQGAGKTTLASTIAGVGKTLFLDLNGEKGVRSFLGDDSAKNIDVLRPTSVTDVDDIFWALAKGGHGYKAVVIDSLTALQKMTMRFLLGHSETAVREIRTGTAPADMRTWGQALDVMVDTATFWFGLADANREEPMHVVFTAQTKMTSDEVSGLTTRVPDVQKGALSITLAAADYVIYCDTEENLDALNDETQPGVHHIVRFGDDVNYRTKGRVPVSMWGKVPSVLGRKSRPNLVSLSRVLGIGGIPAATKKSEATKPSAK